MSDVVDVFVVAAVVVVASVVVERVMPGGSLRTQFLLLTLLGPLGAFLY